MRIRVVLLEPWHGSTIHCLQARQQGSKVRLRLQRSPFEEDEVLLLIALPTIFDDEPRHYQACPAQPKSAH